MGELIFWPATGELRRESFVYSKKTLKYPNGSLRIIYATPHYALTKVRLHERNQEYNT
jgi:hypothetical protein